MNHLELRILSLEKLTNEQAGYISQLKEELNSSQQTIKEMSGRIEVLEKAVSEASQSKSAKATKAEK
nr:MAG TPA: TolA binding protein [Caudoviricetes sp.]